MCFLKKGNKGNKPLQKMIKYSNCKAFRIFFVKLLEI